MGSGRGNSKRLNFFFKKKKINNSIIHNKIIHLEKSSYWSIISGSLAEGKLIIEASNDGAELDSYLTAGIINGPFYLTRPGSKVKLKIIGNDIVIHADDGPAITTPTGSKFWLRNGKLHRDNGPAFVQYGNDFESSPFVSAGASKPGYEKKPLLIEYYKEGKLHRLNGKAYFFTDRNNKNDINGYYIDGEKLDWGQFNTRLREMENPYENINLISADKLYEKGFTSINNYLSKNNNRKLGTKELNDFIFKKSNKLLANSSYDKINSLRNDYNFINGLKNIIEQDVVKNGEITTKLTASDKKRIMNLIYELRKFIIIQPNVDDYMKDIFKN